jgi:hypothetical protein
MVVEKKESSIAKSKMKRRLQLQRESLKKHSICPKPYCSPNNVLFQHVNDRFQYVQRYLNPQLCSMLGCLAYLYR